jgi:hypothetical protein
MVRTFFCVLLLASVSWAQEINVSPLVTGGFVVPIVIAPEKSDSANGGGQNPVAVTHVIPAITNAYTLATIGMYNTHVDSILVNATADGTDWVKMDLLVSDVSHNASHCFMFGLKGLPAGTHTVKYYLDCACSCAPVVTTFSGVDQTTPTGATANTTFGGANDTTATISITNTTGNVVFSSLCGSQNIRGVPTTPQVFVASKLYGGYYTSQSYKSATGTTEGWSLVAANPSGYYFGILGVVLNKAN